MAPSCIGRSATIISTTQIVIPAFYAVCQRASDGPPHQVWAGWPTISARSSGALRAMIVAGTTFTVVFRRREDGVGFVANIAELPGPAAEGASLVKTREALRHELASYFAMNRRLFLDAITEIAFVEPTSFTAEGVKIEATEAAHTFTAVFEQEDNGRFVAYAAELTGIAAEGQCMDEARENLRDAIELYLAANRYIALQRDAATGKSICEVMTLRRETSNCSNSDPAGVCSHLRNEQRLLASSAIVSVVFDAAKLRKMVLWVMGKGSR